MMMAIRWIQHKCLGSNKMVYNNISFPYKLVFDKCLLDNLVSHKRVLNNLASNMRVMDNLELNPFD